MTEVEGEGVAIVAYGIALETVTLLLVGDMEHEPAPSLKPDSLLVNAQPLSRYPHLASIVNQLVKEMLHLPQQILCSLLLGIFPEVKHAHEPLEVLPTSEASDCLLATSHLLVQCFCNELIAKDIVVLKPHRDYWPKSKAVQKEEPDHLVNLFQIKWLVVGIDAPSKTGTLCRSSRVG